MTNLLLLGAVGVGVYYAYSSGMLDSILGGLGAGGPQGPVFDQFETEADGDEDDDDDDDEDDDGDKKGKRGGGGDKKGGKRGDKKGGGKKRGGDRNRRKREDVYPQGGPPQGYPSAPPYIPPAAPPGLTPSMNYVNAPQYPPYTSQTVGTYSQYSPYNQFSSYQEYRTPPRGTASTMPDDNVGFTDIDTNKGYGCIQCQHYCRRSPNSYQCASCRMPCKRISHSFIPPAKGWTIAPVGTLPYGQQGGPTSMGGPQYSPYGSYLGTIVDTLLGKGATFAEMDDYSQSKRFDCHNRLKRRVRGKDNSFVSQSDYYYDRNNINLSIQ